VLVELRLVEQRYKAVLEVLEGAQVTDVARRYGVARQTVHDWLRRYGDDGLAGLADRSSRPARCPHQMPAEVEAKIVELRLAHPGWGPATVRYELAKGAKGPVPGRSSVYRALVRHSLVEGKKRKRRRADYRRFERSRAMELWQMDVVGGFHLSDRTELKAVTGLDDHSRFCVSARLVLRATAKPTCDALRAAINEHGVPEAVMTDNAKTFTARFGRGPGPVLFDRICADNGIKHILTAPYSPTTNGKVERFHKTLRAEFFGPNDYRFATIAEAQAALDAWVSYYNHQRPHQAIGMVAPIERFQLAASRPGPTLVADNYEPTSEALAPRPPGVHRWVDRRGKISLARHGYHVGASFAGEAVEVVCRAGLVDIFHAGVLVATHAERRPPQQRTTTAPRAVARARRPAGGPSVTRIADGNGSVSFAGTMYRAGRAYARRPVQVALVAGSVQLSVDDRVVRVHAARHDPAKEHGAFAMPRGKPRKPKPSLAG
jgi:transposase InsO family protein